MEQQLNAKWERVSRVMLECAETIIGYRTKEHRDWFDERRVDVQLLVDERNKADEAYIRNPSSGSHTKLTETRGCLQRELRRMKNDLWAQLASEIQIDPLRLG